MSKFGVFIIIGLVLGAIVQQVLARVPTDALNVAVGVIFGIAASIPVSLGLLIALTRERTRNPAPSDWNDDEPQPARIIQQPASRPLPYPQTPRPANDFARGDVLPNQMPSQPQIIVLAAPGQFPQGSVPSGFPVPAQWANSPYPYMHEQANTVDARDWRIIGEE